MNETADDAMVERGRRFVRIAAGALVVLELFTIALFIHRVGTDKLPQQGGRLVLTVILAVYLARGRPIARWITFAVSALAVLVVVPAFAGDAFSMPKLPGTLGILVLFLTYGVIARGMIWSESVRAFFRAAKTSHINAGAPNE